MQELIDFLKSDMEEVNNIIIQHIDSEEKLAKVVSSYLINSGGKRLRPMLTILISKIFHYSGKSHYFLASAVEYIHTATLLHDDVVDESDMRRSQLAAHLKWGNKATILVGDFLFSQSFKLMVKANSIKSLRYLSNAFTIIIEGEVRQLYKLQSQKMITEEEYFQIINAKTAELFGTACQIGAVISDQSEEICSKIKELGVNLGLTFQLVDDILDYYGQSQYLGKNIGDDFNEGKITLPMILAYNLSYKKEINFWDNIFFSKDKSSEDFKLAIKILDQYNVRQLVQDKILSFANKSIEIIENLEIIQQYKSYLRELVSYITSRVC